MAVLSSILEGVQAWQRREKLRRRPPRRRPPRRRRSSSSASLPTTAAKNSEEEGFRVTEACQEKGRPEAAQKESCEEARREKGQGADEVDRASSSTGVAGVDGGPCSHRDAGSAGGRTCPRRTCCSLAVSYRVAALGGCRTLCGRASANWPAPQSFGTGSCPPAFYRRTAAFYRRSIEKPGPFCPKFFYCAARYRSLILHAFRGGLTSDKRFITLRFLHSS